MREAALNEQVLLRDDLDTESVLLIWSLVLAFEYSLSLVLNNLLNMGDGGVPARLCFKLPR